MTQPLDKSWHLALDEDEIQIAEFEFQLWRIFYGFLRWQEDCQRYVCNDTLSGYEIALLHIIRMNNRSKTIYELSRLLNRDDPNNIQYGLNKLIKLGLIEKEKSTTTQKALAYKITDQGIKNTDEFCLARSSILIESFRKGGLPDLGLEKLTTSLIKIRGIYDEASRLAASYKKID